MNSAQILSSATLIAALEKNQHSSEKDNTVQGYYSMLFTRSAYEPKLLIRETLDASSSEKAISGDSLEAPQLLELELADRIFNVFIDRGRYTHDGIGNLSREIDTILKEPVEEFPLWCRSKLN